MNDLFDCPPEPEEIIDQHDGIARCAWCDRPATTTATTFLNHDNPACTEHARRYGRKILADADRRSDS